MIIVWGSVEARAEHHEEALRLSLAHVQRSRQEPGCISHTVLIDAERPYRLVFNEEWADMAVLQAHFDAAESLEFARTISRMAVRMPELRIFDSSRLK